MYLKVPWKSKSFAQSSISYFLSSGRREYQRLILNRVWERSSDVQKCLQQYRGVSEVMNIMATGKRSQAKVARLVCEPFVGNTASGYLVNFRKRFHSGNVC